jgi:opacity protein-like surface antigen
MKRIAMLAMLILGAAGFASAQIATPTTDVLGAHLNYGRGCAGCHAPHSGAFGNGAARHADANSGSVALWGEDVGSLYGMQLNTGGGGYNEQLPTTLTAGTPDVMGVLMCLSCHDGNLAKGAMMKGSVYETLPSTYGLWNSVPTLLGNDGTTLGNYLNDHPVGLTAVMGCGGKYDWDCTISSSGKVQMNGPKSIQFVTNYGFFVSPGAYGNQPIVLCTTCHNQHVMNVVNVTNNWNCTTVAGVTSCTGSSGLPTGTYATMFFLRGPYNPADANTTTNQTAQFCRQCHGGESNEMNGSTAGTIF